MKVAVSSTGKELTAQLDPRFGRCGYFIIVETDDMSFEAFGNESAALGNGAGIQSAAFVSSKGAMAVLTGNCGPKAIQALSAGGLEVFTEQAGTVGDAVEKYKKGSLKSTTEATVSEKSGSEITGAMGSAQPRGGGRGMGGGSMGMGRSVGMPGPDQKTSGSLSKNEELRLLKEQAEKLKKQTEEIESRIKSLE